MGAEIYPEGMHSDEGARHAKVFVMSTRMTGYLLETALVPETVGADQRHQGHPVRDEDGQAGKVPNPLKPHKAGSSTRCAS